MRAHWSSVSSWNRDTIPGFQNPAGKFIRHALVPEAMSSGELAADFDSADTLLRTASPPPHNAISPSNKIGTR